MLPQFVRIRANRVIFSPLRAAACRNFSSAPAVPVSLVKALRERTGAPMVECKNALAAEGNDVERAVDWLRKKGVAVAGKKAGRAAAQGLVAVAVSDEGDAGAIVEINSETDFVARNAIFQRLTSSAVASALASLPRGEARTLSGGVGSALAESNANALAGLSLIGGDTDNKACLVGAGVIDVIARIRENLVLRRAGVLHVPGGLVVSYTHNAAATNLGTVGVLLGLRAVSGEAMTLATKASLAEPARRVAMHVAAARPLYATRSDIEASAVARETAVAEDLARTSGKTDPKVLAKMVSGRVNKFFGDFTLPEQPFVFADDGAQVGKWLAAAAKAAGAPPVQITSFCHFVLGEAATGSAEK